MSRALPLGGELSKDEASAPHLEPARFSDRLGGAELAIDDRALYEALSGDRAGELAGVFVPDACAWHHGGATLGRWNPEVVRLISRNQLLLVARHYDRDLLRRWLWPIVAGQLLWGVVAARHGGLAPWLRGKREGLASFHPRGQASPRLREFLLASEAEIRRRATDSYWRWYFRLARAAL